MLQKLYIENDLVSISFVTRDDKSYLLRFLIDFVTKKTTSCDPMLVALT